MTRLKPAIGDTVVFFPHFHDEPSDYTGEVVKADNPGNEFDVIWDINNSHGGRGYRMGYGDFGNDVENLKIVNDKGETVTFSAGDVVRIVRMYDKIPTKFDGQLATYVSTMADNTGYTGGVWHYVTIGDDLFEWAVREIEAVDETDRVSELTAEVESLKTQLAGMKRGREGAENELTAFRKMVAEIALETYDYGDGPWCEDGFREAMIKLGLEEFFPQPKQVTVTLTLPSNSIDGEPIDGDSDIASILYSFTRSELTDLIDNFEVSDE